MRGKGSVRRSTGVITVHYGNPFGGNEMEHGFGDVNIPLPFAETVFELNAAGLANDYFGEPAGLGIDFQQDCLNLAAGIGRKRLIVVRMIVRLDVLTRILRADGDAA